MIAFVLQNYPENFALQLFIIGMFVICVEAIVYLLLNNLHDCTFNFEHIFTLCFSVSIAINGWDGNFVKTKQNLILFGGCIF